MIGKRLDSNENIPLYEVKEIIKERAPEEPTYEQGMSKDYVGKFTGITKAKGEKLLAGLQEIEGISRDLAISIVDILPENPEQVRLLVPKGTELGEESLKLALEAVDKVRK